MTGMIYQDKVKDHISYKFSLVAQQPANIFTNYCLISNFTQSYFLCTSAKAWHSYPYPYPLPGSKPGTPIITHLHYQAQSSEKMNRLPQVLDMQVTLVSQTQLGLSSLFHYHFKFVILYMIHVTTIIPGIF